MLKEDENFNIFKYQYFYNGGGVAIADFNNDGLQDICFTGNMVKNRLFLNEGTLRFKDITEKSGISSAEGWCTGVSAVDINNDGWLDLYICRTGYPFEKLRTNLLYINNGDLTFTEKAKEYGLDNSGYSTQSAFLDYDRDGDLDVFLMNHSVPEYSKGNLEIFSLRNKFEPENGSKLFRNDNGTYVDATESAGIKTNVLSFSLGLITSDINNDGWPDIFIGNDFNESDYLFINNQDGTFTESASSYFDVMSMFSMGCDIADINNDHHMDLVSLDMLPESNYLQKLHSGADNYDKVNAMIEHGFLPQYSRNVLQVNNGDNTFSEKGQMMGISNTDWSWSALFFDFDHDTYQDLFISNGYLRDHTDMDFLQFTMDQVIKIDKGEGHVNFEDYLKSMPPILQPNYFFANDQGQQFINKDSSWNLTTPSVSQGAAYGDLDNDGDLDLVVNNTGDYAWLYRNNTVESNASNFLNLKLTGPEKNKNGLGARVTVFIAGQSFTKELLTCRGFQSNVENKLFFGLGQHATIDSMLITWPDGKVQHHSSLRANQLYEIKYAPDRTALDLLVPEPCVIISEAITYQRNASLFNDFKVQYLLPFFLTDRDPVALTGDINGDHADDLLLFGNMENESISFVQKEKGQFETKMLIPAGKEISDAILVDMDKDGDVDLVTTAGSYRYAKNDPNKGIYFYSNNGKGDFTLTDFLASVDVNPSSIVLLESQPASEHAFLVGSISPLGEYPAVSPLFIVRNNAAGQYEWHNTHFIAGQVNDLVSGDLNQNGIAEIIVAADWAPIQIFNISPANELTDVSSQYFASRENGFWKTVSLYDIDGDGKTEIFAGNLGKNNQLTASTEHPLKLYYDDYDRNGSPDLILAYYLLDDMYPFASREDMIKQIPMLNKRFNSFGLYAKANIKTLLGDSYEKASSTDIHTLENSVYRWQNGKLVRQALPSTFQVAPIYSFQPCDIDQDGTTEILTGGNTTKAKVKLGRLIGNHGFVLKGTAHSMEAMDHSITGFNVKSDIRAIVSLPTKEGIVLGYISHEGKSYFYTVNPTKKKTL